ncbi:MAG: ABC transporter ATP-binding protein [Firmicutes bacterium]|nr:ABC transporter ATP-binding protein [Bacillota bacterium]HXL04602.1 ABC transporter ATP-binding protein [Bacillota bacterium]
MLKVRDLHVYYGGIHALKGISLDVPEGEIATLIGANGAGKTTTLRAITGLVKARRGSIELEGRDITHWPAHEVVRNGVAMAPEGRKIFRNLTVMENLLMGAYPRKDTAGIKKDLDWVTSLFPRLKERFSQKGGTLSGGEQQMLAVGRALMSKPRLLCLDEPSLGLAPVLMAEVYRGLAKIHNEGCTILLIEQNARAALKLANYGYVMETGVIVLEGKGSDLLENEDVRKAYLGE